jgi:hypothetical protein
MKETTYMLVLADAPVNGFESIGAFHLALRADRGLWSEVLGYRREKRCERRLQFQAFGNPCQRRKAGARRDVLAERHQHELSPNWWSAALDHDDDSFYGQL